MFVNWVGESKYMSWYEHAFSQNYLDVYAHRTNEQAIAEVEFANHQLQFKKDQIILDLCCGAGRHSFVIAPKVKTVVGFDLSLDLLQHAVKENLSNKCMNIYWQKGDSRDLNFYNSFDAVVCFFNSYGYFEDENENIKVIRNVYNALKPKGKLLFDIMNKPFIVNNLKPQTEKSINQFIVQELRKISESGLRVEKEVRIFDGCKLVNEYKESVRMYTKNELLDLFSMVGFTSIEFFGSILSEPLNDSSSRLIVVCQKP